MLYNFLKSHDGGLLIGAILFGAGCLICMLVRKRYKLSWVWIIKTFVDFAIITAIIVPWSPIMTTHDIGANVHPVSFIIGPALYTRFGHNLVPGLDYFTQYSVGLPYIFSYFLGQTGPETVFNYIIFFVTVMWLFCISSYCLLFYIFKSRFWALGITLVTVILQFHFYPVYSTGVFSTTAHFVDPSSHFFRFPLLVIAVFCFVRWCARQLNFKWAMLLACCLGISLYWNTETGIYMVAACCLAAIVIFGLRWRVIFKTAALAIGGAAIFVLLSLISFGWRVLSLDFLTEVIAPLVIYTGGFSAVQIAWANDVWAYVINFLTPMLSLASLGKVFRQAALSERKIEVEQAAFIAAISFLALFMQTKYLNRSLSSLWYVNAYPAIVLVGWWLYRLSRLLREAEPQILQSFPASWRKSIGNNRPISLIFNCAMILIIILGIARMPEQAPDSSPTYGLISYLTYPSLANVAIGLKKVDRNMPTQLDQWKDGEVTLCCDDADIRLIQERVPPQEPVAIMSDYDWGYLIAAHRAPLFPFLPSTFTFTFKQLDQITQRSYQYIFVTKGKDNPVSGTMSPDLDSAMTKLLEKNFVKEADGVNLVAYVSKNAKDKTGKVNIYAVKK
jgi:hypothetical protein